MLATVAVAAPAVLADGDGSSMMLINLQPPTSLPLRDHHVDFTINPMAERFVVYNAPGLTLDHDLGLVVLLYSGNSFRQVPPAWASVLGKRNLLLVCPENAGDDVAEPRRLGLAVMAALSLKQKMHFSPHRIYAAGVGGGALMAERLGFYASNIFNGELQIGSADFVAPTSAMPDAPAGGSLDASAGEISAAKKSFRFALVTATHAPNHDAVQNVFETGFHKSGFQSTLVDGPGVLPELCSGASLEAALDFLDGVTTATAKIDAPKPVKPKWMTEDPSRWPQILMHNRIAYPGGRSGGDAGSAEFGRLNNGVVLAFTACHVTGDTPPEQFATAYSSWRTGVSGTPGGARMKQLAIDPADAKRLDTLIMCPESQQTDWPATVLPIRTQPLEEGETVYLVGVPFDSTSRQNVYKGVVDQRQADGTWIYTIDKSFKTTGTSGAPVIDEYGQLAAVNLGHLVESTTPDRMRLYCRDLSELASCVKLPEGVTAAGLATHNTSAIGDNGSDANHNRPADAALHSAQLFIDNKRYAAARLKLQSIITNYPSTDAATQARQLLAGLPQ